tara:strand:- start:112 stop:558 length:447 start_codon:yes stop_codon:yes gene_type:complete
MDLNKIDEFLSSWAEGVINIGKIHSDGGDYVTSAKDFLRSHYAFEETDVLFKPTFTKEMVFRNNKNDALSYFVGGDISEDNGFALKPWKSIQLDELNTLIEEDLVAAMGTLRFKPYKKEEATLVAFTFIFAKISDALKIKVHHSSPVT